LDDEYIGKMEDVLETYEKPYDPSEPVICFDEKPVTFARRRSRADASQAGTGSAPGQRI